MTRDTVTSMVFTVTRTGDSTAASDVAWSIAGSSGSPAAADDFVGNAFPSDTLSFLANESVKTITINVQGDTAFESFDGYTLTLNSATVGTITTATAAGSIVADDFQNLSAGDIVISGLASDAPDEISFVPLVDLQPFAPIVFTDNGWNGTALGTTEGAIVYSAPAGGLTAGTKVAIEFAPTITLLAGTGTAVDVGNFGLSTSGDSLLAYVGLSTAPTFLFGVTTWFEYPSTGVPTTNQTYLPASLMVGTTAVGALGPATPTLPALPGEVDNVQYNDAAGTTGTPAAIRALVANKANWLTDNNPITLTTTNFTISAPTNTAPTITSIAAQTIGAGSATNSLNFTVGDAETADGSLTVTATSTNPTLAPIANIVFSGTGASRSVVVTPVAGQTGSSTMMLTVSDGALSSVTEFTLNVVAAPKVETIVFGDGTDSRSMITSITVNFDSDVSVGSGAFILEQGGSAGFTPIPSIDITISVNSTVVAGKTVSVLTFISPAPSTFIAGGSLPDGNYKLTVQSSLVALTTESSIKLDGDSDGIAGGNFVKGAVEADAFFRRFGDGDGNRTVRLQELGQLRAAINKAKPNPLYDARYDFDSNNTVQLAELGRLRSRINIRLNF